MGFQDILARLFGRKQPQIPDQQQIQQQAKEWSSREYKTFLEIPEEEKGFLQLYKQGCKFAGQKLKLRAPASVQKSVGDALITTDLDVTPDDVFSFTILAAIALFVVMLPLMIFPNMINIMLLFIPPAVAYLILTYPTYFATVTKIKASDETVKAILYMVIYLRLNPQMEGAINFAAGHCTGPIGKDLRKIMWDLQTRRFNRIDSAISSKIEKWLLWDRDFVESMNLIESLSLETNDATREKTLDKTLTFILDSTHEKMKQYSRELQIPITMIHTMGITFPIMGLIMFPMISIFLYNVVDPAYIAVGYVFVLPFFIYFYLRRTISQRPGAFSCPDISEHPDLPPEGVLEFKLGNEKYRLPIMMTALIVAFMIMIPGVVYFSSLAAEWYQLSSLPPKEFSSRWKQRIEIEYDSKNVAATVTLMIYSLSIIWGMGVGIIIYTLGMSSQRLKIRNDVKMIEDEFQIGLFRLGDILSSGMPIESALDEAIEKYQQYKLLNSPMYSFFLTIRKNMRDMGMTLRRAVFDPNYGVIRSYPSVLVRDIMQIIASSAEKSSVILSVAAKTISNFLMKTKKVEEMLKEMLAEVSAAIQVQTNFIAPFICGIVASMATFIILLLKKIGDFLQTIENTFNMGGTFIHSGTMEFTKIMSFMQTENMVPPTLFQLIVGTYMIELIILLAYFLNGIQSGFDKTTRNVLIGKSLITGLIFYSIVVIVGIYVSITMLPAIGSLEGVVGV